MSKNLPKVAIIGQANVGKSSLFNRMIRAQQAVVAREAGTTRDSVLGKVKYKKQAFWLIDTAGLKDPNDEFEATIQEQIQDAVDASELILVVLDSTKPFSNEDRLIAKKALKSRKPVILVLNKTDLKGNLPNEEFLRLGVKPIIRTSAEHNAGVEELLTEIAENIPKAKEEKRDEDIIRVALVGRPNAGKSYLFNTMAGKQQAIVANVAGTTRDTNRTEIKFNEKTIEIIDTAGMRKPGKQEVGIEKFSVLRTLNAIDEADICLLLMDANELNTQLDQRIAGLINDAGKGMIIVVSKWDSVEGKDAYTRDALAPRIAYYFKFTPWAPLIFTSSKTGQNVTKIYDLILKVHRNRARLAKTSILNQLLQKATQAHPPAGLKNTHPKLRYISQSDSNPPWFIIHGSNLKFVHWSYKRYLERLIRENFDYSGTPIKFSFRDEKQIKENRARISAGKKVVNKNSGALKKATDTQNKRERKRDEKLARIQKINKFSPRAWGDFRKDKMKIILFQGNFPEKYNGTRHNAGFEFADYLTKKINAKFQEKPKFKAFIAEISLFGEKVLLVKPTTFYNETGFSARSICDFYKVDFRKDFLAVHDDLDLDFGTIRVRKSGSSAGNNGLKSLISVFGKDFPRIKIGVKNEFLPKIGAMNFVLAKFSKSESEKLPQIFKICEDFVEDFIKDSLQNNKRTV